MKIKHFRLLIILITAFLLAVFIYRRLLPDIELKTDSKTYLHYNFVYINAFPKNRFIADKIKDNRLLAFVYRNDKMVSTVGRKDFMRLSYNKTSGSWHGKWPVPWNAPDGEYHVRIKHLPVPGRKPVTATQCVFNISRRTPKKITPPLAVMNMEYSKPFEMMKVRGPDGTTGGWKNLFKWAEYSGADTFFHLTGQTSAYIEKIDSSFPWNIDNLPLLEEIAAESHKHGLKFGAWVAVYLTFGPRKFAAEYDYAWDYDVRNKRLIKGRGISISDNKRVNDVIEFIKTIKKTPGIDYIGLDYIRNARGGFELVDEFVDDMQVETPSGWGTFNEKQRMSWLGKLVYRRKKKDMAVVEMWNWWRARKIALIVKRIKEESGLKKPLWVFTLSWEKGWQHGQDVIMMNDAGADFAGIMMYECNAEQFSNLINAWEKYISKEDAQLIVGNLTGWPVHQNTLNPSGPEEFYNRLITSANRVYSNGKACGMFIHDLSRILWGRKGPYSTMEWMVSSASALSRIREHYMSVPIEASLVVDNTVKYSNPFNVQVKLKRLDKNSKISDIRITPMPFDGTNIIAPAVIETETFENEFTANYSMIINKLIPDRGLRYMVAAKIDWKDGSKKSPKNTNFVFKYIDIKDYPLLPPATSQANNNINDADNKNPMD